MTNTPPSAESLQERFARRIAAHLSEAAAATPPDIDARLRFAREQALLRARAARVAAEPLVAVGGQGTLGLGHGTSGSGWWVRMASALPVLVLAGGLLLIQEWQSQSQLEAAVEVDTALLSDDLPPDAYSDPGFLEFLKAPQE